MTTCAGGGQGARGTVSKEQRKRGCGKFRNGGVIIKYFRDIASADLNTLLPNVRVVMSMRQMVPRLPALVGGVPILLKLAPVLTVLAVLVGIRPGAAGEDHETFKQSIAVMSGILALGGFVTHQWLKYQRQALRYQLDITDNLYFRNLNNNAGLFDAVIGAAEDQECKEASCLFLPARRADVASEVRRPHRAWLRRQFSCDVDFEVDDGIAKLERFGRSRAPAKYCRCRRSPRRSPARPPLGRFVSLQRAGVGWAKARQRRARVTAATISRGAATAGAPLPTLQP
jgi:hypothetical protein